MLRDNKIRVHATVFPFVDTTGTKGNNKELDIDSFSTQPALLNPYGFPMNDIMAYEESQSESVARSVLQRIKVNPDSPDVDLKRSIDDQFDELCPQNWDSPAEYIRYQKNVAASAYKRAEKIRKAKAANNEPEPISFINNQNKED